MKQKIMKHAPLHSFWSGGLARTVRSISLEWKLLFALLMLVMLRLVALIAIILQKF